MIVLTRDHVKVMYLCKEEDGMIIEKKGSEEEPFEFTERYTISSVQCT